MGLCTPMYCESTVVQVHRTSVKLLEPHHCRDSKVCRVLSHEFGVVRTEYSLTTSLQGKQGVHGSYALVRLDC